MRVAIGLEYDGSSFEGWQTQPHGRTVQDLVEAALTRIAQAPIAVQCAGRTDAGVHAAVQLAHFDCANNRPLSAWVRGANTFLPPGIAIQWAVEVDEAFHARFSARSRRYRYLLLNRAVRPGLHAGKFGWHHAPLALQPMQEAAARLLGEHDFSSFRAAQCQAASPVRELRVAQIRQSGELFVFEFEANAFLHHMIRNIVGALVVVGRERLPPAWMDALLAARNRRFAPPTFSPAGLYLCGVEYDSQWRLPQEGRIIAPFELMGF